MFEGVGVVGRPAGVLAASLLGVPVQGVRAVGVPAVDDATFEQLRRGLAEHLALLLEAPAGGLLAAAVDDAFAEGAVADLTDSAVVELAAGAQRLATWAVSRSLLALAELAARWEEVPGGAPDPAQLRGPQSGDTFRGDLGHRAAVAEVALASGLSSYAVEGRLDVALRAPERLPLAWEQFCGGHLELAKLVEILRQTDPLSLEHARAVDALVLGIALSGNLPQLRAALAAAVLRVDPEGAAQRAKDAHARRQVRSRPCPGGDGMATLALTASTDEIASADASLTALARAAELASSDDGARDADDARGHDATKADVLLDLIAAAHAAYAGHVHGSAEDDAAVDDAAVDDDAADDDAADDAAEDDAAVDDDESDRRESHSGAGDSGRRASWTPSRTEVVVTVPLSTALGLSEAPGELRGFGPVPGPVARRLAEEVARTVRDGYWRCAVVDDRPGQVHGTLLALGRSTFVPRYTPPPGAARFVAARDGTCVFPGCRRRADAADLDHRRPWRASESGDSEGGATCECTLQALCRAHHVLKHRGGFDVLRFDPDGADPRGLVWTTPTGRTYVRESEPLPVDHDPPPF